MSEPEPTSLPERYKQLQRTFRLHLLFMVFWFTVLVLLVALTGLHTGWFGAVQGIAFGAAIGAWIGLLITMRRRMRMVRRLVEDMELVQNTVTSMLRMSGGVAISIIASEEPTDLDPEVREGHPLYDAAKMALDHGNQVCIHLVRTDEGWEVLRAHYPDGAELGPHEPAHEER